MTNSKRDLVILSTADDQIDLPLDIEGPRVLYFRRNLPYWHEPFKLVEDVVLSPTSLEKEVSLKEGELFRPEFRNDYVEYRKQSCVEFDPEIGQFWPLQYKKIFEITEAESSRLKVGNFRPGVYLVAAGDDIFYLKDLESINSSRLKETGSKVEDLIEEDFDYEVELEHDSVLKRGAKGELPKIIGDKNVFYEEIVFETKPEKGDLIFGVSFYVPERYQSAERINEKDTLPSKLQQKQLI